MRERERVYYNENGNDREEIGNKRGNYVIDEEKGIDEGK
jgi:hypothetical protein